MKAAEIDSRIQALQAWAAEVGAALGVPFVCDLDLTPGERGARAAERLTREQRRLSMEDAATAAQRHFADVLREMEAVGDGDDLEAAP